MLKHSMKGFCLRMWKVAVFIIIHLNTMNIVLLSVDMLHVAEVIGTYIMTV